MEQKVAVAFRVKTGPKVLRDFALHSIERACSLSEFSLQVFSGLNDAGDGFCRATEPVDNLRFEVSE